MEAEKNNLQVPVDEIQFQLLEQEEGTLDLSAENHLYNNGQSTDEFHINGLWSGVGFYEPQSQKRKRKEDCDTTFTESEQLDGSKEECFRRMISLNEAGNTQAVMWNSTEVLNVDEGKEVYINGVDQGIFNGEFPLNLSKHKGDVNEIYEGSNYSPLTNEPLKTGCEDKPSTSRGDDLENEKQRLILITEKPGPSSDDACYVQSKASLKPENLEEYQCWHTGKRHNQVHTEEKPNERIHKCNVCGKTFKEKFRLKRHNEIHTREKPKERPHKCHVCEKAFQEKSGLKRHTRIHTGEKPYECTLCARTFNASGNLACHIRIHTGEKPFKCGVCQKAFLKNSDLTRHTRIHEKKDIRAVSLAKCVVESQCL